MKNPQINVEKNIDPGAPNVREEIFDVFNRLDLDTQEKRNEFATLIYFNNQNKKQAAFITFLTHNTIPYSSLGK